MQLWFINISFQRSASYYDSLLIQSTGKACSKASLLGAFSQLKSPLFANDSRLYRVSTELVTTAPMSIRKYPCSYYFFSPGEESLVSDDSSRLIIIMIRDGSLLVQSPGM